MRSRIRRRSDMCSLGVGLSRRSIQVLTGPKASQRQSKKRRVTRMPPFGIRVVLSFLIDRPHPQRNPIRLPGWFLLKNQPGNGVAETLVLSTLKDAGRAMSPAEMARELDEPRDTVKKRMAR